MVSFALCSAYAVYAFCYNVRDTTGACLPSCMSMELGIYAHKEPCTSTLRALTDLFLLPFTGRFYHATTVLELHRIGNILARSLRYADNRNLLIQSLMSCRINSLRRHRHQHSQSSSSDRLQRLYPQPWGFSTCLISKKCCNGPLPTSLCNCGKVPHRA